MASMVVLVYTPIVINVLVISRLVCFYRHLIGAWIQVWINRCWYELLLVGASEYAAL